MKIEINQVATSTLSCEPLIERTKNGELLCVCQCDGIEEPAPENRVYVFHSKDEGKTWSQKESIYPEDGNAVYCTELTSIDNEITAYLTVHSGRFLYWNCEMMKSTDNGYTFKKAGPPPFFPEYTFMRGMLRKRNGQILLPYQHYPMDKAEVKRVAEESGKETVICTINNQTVETGVLISNDNGKTFEKYKAFSWKMDKWWIWTEPTLAELSDGTISMLIRKEAGHLFRCDSKDGGYTWGEVYETDIPNPSNKPRLIPIDNGRIALIHTPSKTDRQPLELWISDDDMKTWGKKIKLTDFPGCYHYADGFYENGAIHFVIEHNRHTILYFKVTL